MSKNTKTPLHLSLICLTFLAMNCLFYACQTNAPSTKETTTADIVQNTRNTPLIHTSTLNSWQAKSKPPIVVEVSPAKTYAKGHISQAQNVWREDFNNTDTVRYAFKGMRADKQKINQLLQRLGVNANDSIVLYDARGGCEATRLWWILDIYHFRNAFVLDGGKKVWEQNYPLDTSSVSVEPSTFQLPEKTDNNRYTASLEEVKIAIQDTNVVLLDTRTTAEFSGQCYVRKGKAVKFNPSGYGAGAIAKAIHYDWGNAVQLNDDHSLKSKETLLHDLAQLGITKDKTIIAYCQSGTRSSHTAFVLGEVLGFPKVKNYDGSWIEWSYHQAQGDSLPVAVHTSVSKNDSLYQILDR